MTNFLNGLPPNVLVALIVSIGLFVFVLVFWVYLQISKRRMNNISRRSKRSNIFGKMKVDLEGGKLEIHTDDGTFELDPKSKRLVRKDIEKED